MASSLRLRQFAIASRGDLRCRALILKGQDQLCNAAPGTTCRSGANRTDPAKGKARDLIEITGLFWLREPETTDS